jgi:hypothetical protein
VNGRRSRKEAVLRGRTSGSTAFSHSRTAFVKGTVSTAVHRMFSIYLPYGGSADGFDKKPNQFDHSFATTKLYTEASKTECGNFP